MARMGGSPAAAGDPAKLAENVSWQMAVNTEILHMSCEQMARLGLNRGGIVIISRSTVAENSAIMVDAH